MSEIHYCGGNFPLFYAYMTGCRPSAKELLSEFPSPDLPLSPVIYEAFPDSNPPSPSFRLSQFEPLVNRPSDTVGIHLNGGNLVDPNGNFVLPTVEVGVKQTNQTMAEGSSGTGAKGKDAANGSANDVGVASEPGKRTPLANGSSLGYQNRTGVVSGSTMASSSRYGIGRESPPPARHTDSGFADGEDHSHDQLRGPIAKSASQTLPKSKIPQRQVSDKFQASGIPQGKT